MTDTLDKSYNPRQVQEVVTARWDQAGAHHAVPDKQRDPFVIVIPPPNVTAALHMGHALNNTLQDVLVRWRRMAGDNAEWMPGTDHAGIATQTVVDKRLQASGEPALADHKRMEADGEGGREKFIEKVQEWKDEYEQRITHQLKQMGCSCDWDRQRFTMDAVCAAAVREAFFQLFTDGLIYRGKRLVNWDPVTQTALADDEVEMEPVDGNFWYMKYPLVDDAGNDTGEFCTVATTRPETMLGDTAVAVNPNDAPRAKYIGRRVRLPIVNRAIPVIADDHVVIPDPEGDEMARMASGFLKVTPAHDPNDYEIGDRHWDEIESVVGHVRINVLGPDATISFDHDWPEEDRADADAFLDDLKGMDRYEAREAIVTWFRKEDLLSEVKPHLHSVGHSYRSHVPVEPWLSDQWYVKVTDDRLAGTALRSMHPSQRTAQQSRDRKGAPPSSEKTRCVAYLITFTTHGTWLHGDTRGSVDPEHNEFGSPVLAGDEAKEREEFNRQKQPSTTLDRDARRAVQDTVMEVAQHRGWHVHALHVRSNHVHVVVAAPCEPETVMGDFKSYATRRLRDQGLVDAERRVWARHGSTRYLWDDESVRLARRYVVDGQGEAIDPPAFVAEGETLPHGRGSVEERGDGKLRFYPARYAKTFQSWHENIRDWCISRQLWWGHRIPVWSQERPEDCGDDEGTPIESMAEEDERIAITRSPTHVHVCLREDDPSLIAELEATGFTQDPDVLDTWFSSALWPISTMGWPDPQQFADGTPDGSPAIPEGRALLDHWNPSSVLCTAREIITLWVSRMVMFNRYFRDGKLPFTDVFIHAMIQDGEGQKMSKSLGNGVDPLDIIHSHGADAMRFTLAQMTTQTQDVRMPVDIVCPHCHAAFHPQTITTSAGHVVAAPVVECRECGKKMVSSFGVASGEATPTDEMPPARNTSSKFDNGRNLCNKLWNAGRFVLQKLGDTPGVDAAAEHRSLADRWILARLARTLGEVNDALVAYEFNRYAQTLYDFFWRDYCDWYVEAVKAVIAAEDESGAAARQTLAACLDAICRMMHPVVPFITERLWEQIAAVSEDRSAPGLKLPPNDLCMRAAWPEADAELLDAEAERDFALLQSVITAVRNIRNEYNVRPRQSVDLYIHCSAEEAAVVQANREVLEMLATASLQEAGPDVSEMTDAATAVIGEMQIFIGGLIDTEAERDRLSKRQEELRKNRNALQGRLNNKGYVEKAPAHLVRETRDKLAEIEAELERVEANLGRLEAGA